MLAQHQPHCDLRAETVRQSSAAPPGAPQGYQPSVCAPLSGPQTCPALAQFRAGLALLLVPAGLKPEISRLAPYSHPDLSSLIPTWGACSDYGM